MPPHWAGGGVRGGGGFCNRLGLGGGRSGMIIAAYAVNYYL
jgi:hypothetical protein